MMRVFAFVGIVTVVIALYLCVVRLIAKCIGFGMFEQPR